MRFISWNIQQGGGSRVDRIVAQLVRWNPDVVGLSEFRGSEPSQRIAAALAECGLRNQVSTTDSERRNRNGVFLASRSEIEVRACTDILADSGRWIHAGIESIDVMVMHVPNRRESSDKEAKYKFHDSIVDVFSQLKIKQAVAFGDTNTGRKGIDEQATTFFNDREDQWFDRIEEAGWADVWRSRNPGTREYTWYNRSGAKAGFRLDQLFATKSIEPQIRNLRYDWGEGGRPAKLSDHAAIVFDM